MRLCFLLTFCVITLGSRAAVSSKPNIIFVLCDDLGFGDTGPTFQNERAAKHDRSLPAFATPQLDRMASEGMVLRNHYCAAPVCAPSRASLLLGVHQGHANVRNAQFDKALANNHTLATVLKQAGYATAAFGKWGLHGRLTGERRPAKSGEEGGGEEPDGANPEAWAAYPTKRGFDYFYGYVRHTDGHLHYPKEDGKQVWENNSEVSAGLDLCYTTDLFTARAKKWVIDHRAAASNQPFFLYLAYDTPHAKLQYPPCAYPAGGGLEGGVQWNGKPGAMLNTSKGKLDGWCDSAVAQATWDDDRNLSTPEVSWPEAQMRYATSVRRIDSAIGDLLQLIRDLGMERQTLVVFTSDNGPSKESFISDMPYAPTFFAGFDPFDGIKRDVLEGGVRVPAIVWWPGHVSGGKISHTPSGMWDWMPTFAELGGLPAPAASDGVSLVPTLTGKGTQRPSTIYGEYFHDGKSPGYTQFAPANRGRTRKQMQFMIEGRFTGVRYDIKSANDDFEIYDVELDPQQANNLAKQPAFAALQRQMKDRVLQLRRPDSSSPRPYDNAPIPALTLAKLTVGAIACQIYEGHWPWVPEFATLQAVRKESVQAIDLSLCPKKDNVGLAFVGFFNAPTEGEYTFTLTSDGGAELFLHDARVIDDDFARSGNAVSSAIRLAAGWHPIRLYYRHAVGERNLTFEYSGPSIAKQIVPPSAFATAAQ